VSLAQIKLLSIKLNLDFYFSSSVVALGIAIPDAFSQCTELF